MSETARGGEVEGLDKEGDDRNRRRKSTCSLTMTGAPWRKERLVALTV